METNVKSHPRRALLRAIRWGAVGAAVGASCAAFYGAVFGEVEVLLVGRVWRLLPLVGYFAFCGLVAGALIGTVAGVLNGHLGRAVSRLSGRAPGSNDRRDEGTV